MSWNYRVMRIKGELIPGHPGTEEAFYRIHEVYYEGDTPNAWSTDPMAPYGDTVEDLQADIQLMMKAFDQPVLDLEELEKEHGSKGAMVRGKESPA